MVTPSWAGIQAAVTASLYHSIAGSRLPGGRSAGARRASQLLRHQAGQQRKASRWSTQCPSATALSARAYADVVIRGVAAGGPRLFGLLRQIRAAKADRGGLGRGVPGQGSDHLRGRPEDGRVARPVRRTRRHLPPDFAGKEYETELGERGIPATYLEYLGMLRDVFADCWRVLEPGGRIQ